MTPGFVTVPEGDRYWLRNASVPTALLTELPRGAPVASDGLAIVDLEIRDRRIAAVTPGVGASSFPHEGGAALERSEMSVDLRRGQVWPCLIDLHTHLDKGHTWERAPNLDGTFDGALRAVAVDRTAHWSAEDVRRRMDFGLRCSWAHGTKVIRTHLDSMGAQAGISWPVFEGLGAVAYMTPEIDTLLDRLLDLAAERGLDVDLHCDESGDVGARSLSHLARAVLRRRFRGQVLCGHCCSLAVQPPDVVAETLDLVVEAGISVVSLPMCNLYLQDRVPGRTPRWRGVTLLHELATRGVPVAVASDNCRDAFHGFGDHDMLEVFREAARVCHLDRPYGNWPRAVTTTPADVMGIAAAGRIGPGQPADLVLFEGRTWSELLSRPQANRIVVRNGRPIERRVPDYRELDDLLATKDVATSHGT
jgi:cytosine/creatinine deaminase